MASSSPPPPPTIGSKSTPAHTFQLQEILKANGITDPISEVIVKDSGLEGENFGSLVEHVTVKFEDTANKPELHLFVKRKTDNADFNRMLEEWQAFEKEASFYMDYLPRAREFCKSVGSVGHEELMDIYPKCYYGDDKLILLENLMLGTDNYVLLDKEERQDMETAKIALINLAKHHVISHALIRELGGPGQFFRQFPKLEFEAFCIEGNRGMLSPDIENGVKTNIQILEKCGGRIEGTAEAIELYTSVQGKQFDEMLESLKVTPGEFLVLNHGDYWNNNMMFLKDKDNSKILHQITVDFQGVRYASPSVDLSFYLFTNVKPTVRRKHFQELLSTYLNALKETGTQLGDPIELSLQELETGFRKHFHYGFWFGLIFPLGAGHQILKDIEISINELPETADSLNQQHKNVKEVIRRDTEIAKWVKDHPGESREEGENIIQ